MSLLETRVQEYIGQSQALDKYEERATQTGALNAFNAQTNDPAGIISDDLKQKAFTSQGKELEVPVIDTNEQIQITNTRTVTIADANNTSKRYKVVFQTISSGFTVIPSLHMNNWIDEQRDFTRKLTTLLNKFAKHLDSEAVAVLTANKSQVFADYLDYVLGGNTIKASWKQRENLVGDLEPMMNANDFYGQIHMIGNTGFLSILRKLEQLGEFNAVNKQLEYAGRINHFSNRVENDTEAFATGYAVQSGSLGLLTRVEREAYLGTKTNLSYEWGQTVFPQIGDFPIGTYFYQSVGDQSASNGVASADMTRNLKEHYGFSVDVAFVVAYNSDPAENASPIMKFEVAKETDADAIKVIQVTP